jgi:hypothetical protein
MTKQLPPPLSPAGHARRQQILTLAQSALASRRRRRTKARIAAAAVLTLGALALTLLATRAAPTTPSPSLTPAPTLTRSGPTPAPAHHLLVQYIHTDLAALERARITTQAIPPAALIDDDQLQDLLRESGRDPGLIRVGNRIVLSSDLSAECPAETDPTHTPG